MVVRYGYAVGRSTDPSQLLVPQSMDRIQLKQTRAHFIAYGQRREIHAWMDLHGGALFEYDSSNPNSMLAFELYETFSVNDDDPRPSGFLCCMSGGGGGGSRRRTMRLDIFPVDRDRVLNEGDRRVKACRVRNRITLDQAVQAWESQTHHATHIERQNMEYS